MTTKCPFCVVVGLVVASANVGCTVRADDAESVFWPMVMLFWVTTIFLFWALPPMLGRAKPKIAYILLCVTLVSAFFLTLAGLALEPNYPYDLSGNLRGSSSPNEYHEDAFKACEIPLSRVGTEFVIYVWPFGWLLLIPAALGLGFSIHEYGGL
jgi:hypothetical protein